MGKEAFLKKAKRQFCLSQWEKSIYYSQSWKERRLLHESMFIQFDKQTLILKNNGRKCFSYEAQTSVHLAQWVEWVYGSQSWKKEIITWIRIYLIWQMNFDSKKWWDEKFFLWNQSINVINPNEENEFMVTNHEENRDYYLNPYLSQFTNELYF